MFVRALVCEPGSIFGSMWFAYGSAVLAFTGLAFRSIGPSDALRKLCCCQCSLINNFCYVLYSSCLKTHSKSHWNQISLRTISQSPNLAEPIQVPSRNIARPNSRGTHISLSQRSLDVTAELRSLNFIIAYPKSYWPQILLAINPAELNVDEPESELTILITIPWQFITTADFSLLTFCRT